MSPLTVSTKLARIAEQSKRDATLVFTTLAHLMDEDFLTGAFHQLRKDAAAGIDEMSATEYEVGLKTRIADLHRRLVAREYRAQPAKRVWIPKSDGGQRPLAILVLEDKIVQRAIGDWCREHLHQELAEQWRMLSAKLRGHYQYYGLRGNFKMLEVAYEYTRLMWKQSLRRRNSKDRMSWEKFEQRVAGIFPLPLPRIVHGF